MGALLPPRRAVSSTPRPRTARAPSVDWRSAVDAPTRQPWQPKSGGAPSRVGRSSLRVPATNETGQQPRTPKSMWEQINPLSLASQAVQGVSALTREVIEIPFHLAKAPIDIARAAGVPLPGEGPQLGTGEGMIDATGNPLQMMQSVGRRYMPLGSDIATSMVRTGNVTGIGSQKNIIGRYQDAVEQGEWVNTMIEDVGNVAIVAGGLGKVAGTVAGASAAPAAASPLLRGAGARGAARAVDAPLSGYARTAQTMLPPRLPAVAEVPLRIPGTGITSVRLRNPDLPNAPQPPIFTPGTGIAGRLERSASPGLDTASLAAAPTPVAAQRVADFGAAARRFSTGAQFIDPAESLIRAPGIVGRATASGVRKVAPGVATRLASTGQAIADVAPERVTSSVENAQRRITEASNSAGFRQDLDSQRADITKAAIRPQFFVDENLSRLDVPQAQRDLYGGVVLDATDRALDAYADIWSALSPARRIEVLKEWNRVRPAAFELTAERLDLYNDYRKGRIDPSIRKVLDEGIRQIRDGELERREAQIDAGNITRDQTRRPEIVREDGTTIPYDQATPDEIRRALKDGRMEMPWLDFKVEPALAARQAKVVEAQLELDTKVEAMRPIAREVDALSALVNARSKPGRNIAWDDTPEGRAELVAANDARLAELEANAPARPNRRTKPASIAEALVNKIDQQLAKEQAPEPLIGTNPTPPGIWAGGPQPYGVMARQDVVDMGAPDPVSGPIRTPADELLIQETMARENLRAAAKDVWIAEKALNDAAARAAGFFDELDKPQQDYIREVNRTGVSMMRERIEGIQPSGVKVGGYVPAEPPISAPAQGSKSGAVPIATTQTAALAPNALGELSGRAMDSVTTDSPKYRVVLTRGELERLTDTELRRVAEQTPTDRSSGVLYRYDVANMSKAELVDALIDEWNAIGRIGKPDAILRELPDDLVAKAVATASAPGTPAARQRPEGMPQDVYNRFLSGNTHIDDARYAYMFAQSSTPAISQVAAQPVVQPTTLPTALAASSTSQPTTGRGSGSLDGLVGKVAGQLGVTRQVVALTEQTHRRLWRAAYDERGKLDPQRNAQQSFDEYVAVRQRYEARPGEVNVAYTMLKTAAERLDPSDPRRVTWDNVRGELEAAMVVDDLTTFINQFFGDYREIEAARAKAAQRAADIRGFDEPFPTEPAPAMNAHAAFHEVIARIEHMPDELRRHIGNDFYEGINTAYKDYQAKLERELSASVNRSLTYVPAPFRTPLQEARRAVSGLYTEADRQWALGTKEGRAVAEQLWRMAEHAPTSFSGYVKANGAVPIHLIAGDGSSRAKRIRKLDAPGEVTVSQPRATREREMGMRVPTLREYAGLEAKEMTAIASQQSVMAMAFDPTFSKAAAELPEVTAALAEWAENNNKAMPFDEFAQILDELGYAVVSRATPSTTPGPTGRLDAIEFNRVARQDGAIGPGERSHFVVVSDPITGQPIMQAFDEIGDMNRLPDVRVLPSYLAKVGDDFLNPKSNAFLTMYDQMTQLWKTATLAWSVAWVTYNAVGNALMATFSYGQSPGRLVANMRTIRNEIAALNEQAGYGSSRPFKTAMKYDTLSALVPTRMSAHGPSWAERLSTKQLSDQDTRMGRALDYATDAERSWIGKVTEFSYTLNEFTDNMFRTSVLMEDLHKRLAREAPIPREFLEADGALRMDLTPDETRQLTEIGAAANKALETSVRAALNTMGDFTRLSPIERKYVKRVFPFYPWLRHQTAMAFRIPLQNPLRWAWMQSLATMLQTDEDGDAMNRLMAGMVPTPFGGIGLGPANPFGKGVTAFGSGTEGSSLFDPKSMLAAVNPIPKTAASLVTGIDFNQGAAISRAPDQKVTNDFGQQVGGSAITRLGSDPLGGLGEIGFTLAGMVPQARGLRDLVLGPQPRYDSGDAITYADPRPGGRLHSLARAARLPFVPTDITYLQEVAQQRDDDAAKAARRARLSEFARSNG